MVLTKKRGSPRRRSQPPQAGAPAEPPAFVIREVTERDLEPILALARHLDSVNLPHNRSVLGALIRRSRQSFSQRITDPFRREYLFVLELGTGQVVGTSMLLAQHGHPDAPHIYFDVLTDERYSVTLDRHFSHKCLRLGFNYRGPTEIGGLVLDPAMRALGIGKPLSFVRFLFIAMYRERFRPQVIAELMPPILPDGRSELWEWLGRHFTGLSYQEADKLSKTNKEFITSLFPQIPIYASLLPPNVQSLIGEVGEATRGVKRMLEGVGFTYSERIDPFDGGPHFECETDQISLVRLARSLDLKPEPPDAGMGVRHLLAKGSPTGPCRFVATAGLAQIDEDGIRLDEATKARLGVRRGQLVHAVPY